MRTRVAMVALPLFLCLLLLTPAPAQSAAAPLRVLLLFDSLAKGTAHEGNVDELQKQLESYSVQVTLMNLDLYVKGSMNNYSNVITVINAADLTSDNHAYLEDLADYKGQYLHIGYNPTADMKQTLHLSVAVQPAGSASLRIGGLPEASLQVQDMPYIAASQADQSYGNLLFLGSSVQVPYAVSSGKYTYVPYLNQGDGSSLAMACVLREWLHITDTPHSYLVLKEIYPVSNLSLLQQMADRLYQKGVPFIASVRPVFTNTDFPAMMRYLEALKAVQARNGSIVVNVPVVRPAINRSDHTLQEKMSGFINLLAEQGIAPLGVGAERYWAYDKEYTQTGLLFFDSAVLFPNEELRYMEQTNTSKAFTSSLYSVPLDDLMQQYKTGSRGLTDLPMNTAIVADFPEDEAGVEKLLQKLEQSWIPFADYKQEAHRVATDTHIITSSQGVISINGQELNIDYSPKAVSTDFEYEHEQVKSFTRLFSVQNQFFIVAIIVSLVFFGGLLVIGYRMYRRKYMK
ncbi:hypothetical protein A8L34_24240 [Bacillus sp. FJAT-27264]|uniref:hypothetical protein n=1 Tax=Paenibacillus sp. (strain DSM 101736 / FJAT-27264) TaxID=1850362 RepID=UPI000808143D|nr:hypothetical protein [Bacillus sp. FJAT-27264]OBZ08419.1 hypothetical protein A8L34_24240 [Bacillus sp. FJAT-27264]